MEADHKSLRREAAAAGRAVMANTLSYDEFMSRFGYSDDELVSDLVYLLEHEPQRGGFFGVNEREWAQHQSQLTEAIGALEA